LIVVLFYVGSKTLGLSFQLKFVKEGDKVLSTRVCATYLLS